MFRYRFLDWGVKASGTGGIRVSDALATQFQHDRRDRGDARLDAGAGVVVQVAALFQVVELDQGPLRAAVEIGGLRPRLAGADRVAGDLVDPRERGLEQRVVAGPGQDRKSTRLNSSH